MMPAVMMRVLSLTFLATAFIAVSLTAFASPPVKPRPASQLYLRYCVSCHGTDGRAKTSKGKFSHARDFTDATWQDDVSDERLFNSITNGRNVRGNMPSFGNKLNPREIESMVGFVRKLKG